MNHSNNLKVKTHMIILLNAEIIFAKYLTLLCDKSIRKIIQGTFLNIIKVMYSMPMANIKLYGEKFKALKLKSGTRKGCPLYLYP